MTGKGEFAKILPFSFRKPHKVGNIGLAVLMVLVFSSNFPRKYLFMNLFRLCLISVWWSCRSVDASDRRHMASYLMMFSIVDTESGHERKQELMFLLILTTCFRVGCDRSAMSTVFFLFVFSRIEVTNSSREVQESQDLRVFPKKCTVTSKVPCKSYFFQCRHLPRNVSPQHPVSTSANIYVKSSNSVR